VGGLDDACNNEAIRVVKLLKFVVPKNPRHLKITFHKNITIHFRIQETKNTSPEFPTVTPIQYHITPSVSLSKTTEEPKAKSVVYTYTVNFK
jgi:protein TonB